MVSKIVVCGIRGGYTVDVTNTGHTYQFNIWKGSEIIKMVEDDDTIDMDLSDMFSELAILVKELETGEFE